MRRAEELGDLAPEQCSSIKCKESDNHALNTQLFYDLVRLSRVLATSTFPDLFSNYNLVVHIIVPLLIQRDNTPK